MFPTRACTDRVCTHISNSHIAFILCGPSILSRHVPHTQLRLLGFKPRQMETGGYPSRYLQATDGRSVKELRDASFTCQELRDSGGFTFEELRAGGKASRDQTVGLATHVYTSTRVL